MLKKRNVIAGLLVVLLTVSVGGAAEEEFPATVQRLEHNPMAKAIVGQRYEAMVPDTLDIAGRMELALNALTNLWFPEEKYANVFGVGIGNNSEWTGCMTDAYLNLAPKYIEGLAVCRLGSGSDLNIDVDKEVLQAKLELLGADGLTYAPEGTLPNLKGPGNPRNFSELWGEGRNLIALSMLYQIDGDQRWVEIGKRKIDRLLELSIKNDRFRFYLTGRFRPGMVMPSDITEPTTELWESMHKSSLDFYTIYSVGATGHGAGLFYRVTGYEPALELSEGLAKWALASKFMNEDGSFGVHHVHHNLYALMAVCEYAVAANDLQTLQRVDACYRWARGNLGDPLIGWYMEHFTPDYVSSETCENADMVWLALYLTRAGVGDYWDDVDRWVRNAYIEGQILSVEQLNSNPYSLNSLFWYVYHITLSLSGTNRVFLTNLPVG